MEFFKRQQNLTEKLNILYLIKPVFKYGFYRFF